MSNETLFIKTPEGQLLYDLAFVTLSDKWLAGKHGIPIAEVRQLRDNKSLLKLRRSIANNKSKTARAV